MLVFVFFPEITHSLICCQGVTPDPLLEEISLGLDLALKI